MDDILQPFTNYFVVIYLDDILIFNRTWDEHLKHIQQVLSTLQQHKLYVNLEKCSFGMERVWYMGYIVYKHGAHVNPFNIKAINDWMTSTTLTELRSFLGFANFYRIFVLGFSNIAKAKFVWYKPQQHTFEGLKQCLCLEPVLTLPGL